VCVIACLTNFIANASGTGSVHQLVDPILTTIQTVLQDVCQRDPARSFMISPPMYRTTPIWYRDGLPEILSSFSKALCEDRPKNLHLLPSFATPEYDQDGIHLTPYSGLEFVLDLFDQAEELLARLKLDPTTRCNLSAESTRVLEDRVMVLEQDHRRLNRFVEKKSAIDAELADFRENERLEDCFVISGLPSLSSSLTGKEWQSQAVASVQKFLVDLLGRECPIVVVQNVTPRSRDAETIYNVRMAHVEDSRAVRRKFGGFFQGGTDGRPDLFKEISVKNRVTSDTRIRISLLKLMAKRYKDSNPGSKVQVIGYDPRPLLKVIPPSTASDRRTKVYNYVEACRAFPTTFAAKDLDPIMKRIHPSLRGQIRSTFIVLSDDQLSRNVSSASSMSTSSSASNDGSESVVGAGSASGDQPRRGTRRERSASPASVGQPSAKR
jgi:hypothetical protein